MMTIPLMIISGFLGAGKTTLLNHLLNADHGLKIAVMVNDFGTINIDSQLVVGVDGQTVTLSNGCICCTIRDDLKQETLRLLETSQGLDYIVIETSGVSDPVAVAATFRDVELRPHIRVDCVLTVVDAETILENLDAHEGLARAQIMVADMVLINKVDLVDEDRLGDIRRSFAQIIPQAHLITASHGQVALDLLIDTGRFDPRNLPAVREVHVHEVHDVTHAHHHELVFETWSWVTEQPLSLATFGEFIEGLPKSIIRVKGLLNFVERPEQVGELHIVGKRAALKMRIVEQPSHASQLVFISGQGGMDCGWLEEHLEACLVKE